MSQTMPFDKPIRVYDARPTLEGLRARCARDKVDFSTVVEVLVPMNRYALRTYAYPANHVVYEADGPKLVPGYVLYKLRRDGRICNGWGLTHPATKMLEIQPVQGV